MFPKLSRAFKMLTRNNFASFDLCKVGHGVPGGRRSNLGLFELGAPDPIKAFPAKFKKNQNLHSYLLLDLNIEEKKLNNWSPCQFFVPNFFWSFFFKFYMFRPFQNAQILEFWFSEWKVMTVWRYFFGQFLTKNRVKFKKLFLENKKFGISKIQP
jgi:hypothetical protein